MNFFTKFINLESEGYREETLWGKWKEKLIELVPIPFKLGVLM